jgi:glucokinase
MAVTEAARLGADLGGTQLRLAVVQGGQLASELLTLPTGLAFGPTQLRDGLCSLEQRLRTVWPGALHGLGLGVAGIVRPGPLSQSDNLPLLVGTDIAALVANATGQPARIENDARCFVLAEARHGAARGARHVVGITLGTGVGCGVMVDGRLHHGASHEAGEVCMLPTPDGPLEHYLSGVGVVRRYHALGGTQPCPGGAAQLADLAREGDPLARAAWHALARDLAFLCACCASLLDPEVYVLGGSLVAARDLFDAPLRTALGARSARVVYARLGPAAGVIGAAALHESTGPQPR